MPHKILIVDDEPDLEMLIKAKLKKHIAEGTYEFLFAMNGLEALNVLKETPDVNIVLTDINMPVMDGLTLLEHLIDLKRLYKAVVVSAYGDISNIRTAMNRGASDFIMKPINFDDFRGMLAKMCNEYQAALAAMLAESHLSELKIELNIAKAIQESMLPSNLFPFPSSSLDIAGRMIPAKEVGGDFFDFFPVSEDLLAIVIADVSGKNISACLYMVVARALFRAMSESSLSCQEVIKRVDRTLSRDNLSCMFVTALYGLLNINTGQLICCNAGHNRPYLLKKNGDIQQASLKSGRALGLDLEFCPPTDPFEEVQLQLEKGDAIFLYTDGVTEALNLEGELYGEKRLEKRLELDKERNCSEILHDLVDDLHTFTNHAPQSDDITMLVIRL